MNTIDLLKNSLSLSSSDLELISPLITFTNMAKGQLFSSPGEPALNIAYIVRGLFKVYYIDQEGKQSIKAFRKEKDFIGPFRKEKDFIGPYIEFLQAIPTLSYTEAIEDSELIIIDINKLRELFDHSANLQKLGRELVEKLYIEKERREYYFLQHDAKGRYLAFIQEYAPIIERIPQNQIAQFIGVTEVSLSRLKKSLS